MSKQQESHTLRPVSEAEIRAENWTDAFRVVRIVQRAPNEMPALHSSVQYPGFEYVPGRVTEPGKGWGPMAVFATLEKAAQFVSDANEVVVRCKYKAAEKPGFWDAHGASRAPTSWSWPLDTRFAAAIWLPEEPYCTIEELMVADPCCFINLEARRQRAYRRVWEWYCSWRRTGTAWDWEEERKAILHELNFGPVTEESSEESVEKGSQP